VEHLKLRVEPKAPEPVDELPTGWVWIEHGPQRAVLLTPDEIDFGRRYPLVTVLHGAGRQDEMLIKAYRDEAEERQAFFLIPRSFHMTWDLIALGLQGGGGPNPEGHEPPSDRPDLDFLEYAYDLIYRRFPVDHRRQGLVGYSDGASYGLSIGLSNPHVFRALAVWAAGFVALDDTAAAEGTPRPAVLVEYGTHDELFPFEKVALPMKQQLTALGCDLSFRVDEGGKHWPSGTFQSEALDWFFSEPWEPRS
jgi:poly(3-hydroxybutyrate) depolymerase